MEEVIGISETSGFVKVNFKLNCSINKRLVPLTIQCIQDIKLQIWIDPRLAESHSGFECGAGVGRRQGNLVFAISVM